MNSLYLLHAFHRAHVVAHARVDAALSEVPVDGHDVAELIHQGLELAQIGAQLRGRNGGVFPSLPQLGHAGHICNRAQGRFPNTPHALCLLSFRAQWHAAE